MKFLVFQHIGVEHPGSFRHLMKRDGIVWDTVALNDGEPIPELSAYDGLLVFGGPMDIWQEAEYPWFIPEKAAIRRFVTDLRKPFLGICLGHQLLADALGGVVGPMAKPEVGVLPLRLTDAGRADPLFHGFAEPMMALQWHGAEVKKLPPDAVILAENEACPVQAIRVGDRAYGLQYHVEVEERTVAEWGEIPTYRCALETIEGGTSQQQFEQDAARQMSLFNRTAETLFNRFCAFVAQAK